MTVTDIPTTTAREDAWEDFVPGAWSDSIDVRDFIQANYRPYEGDAAFLSEPTERTCGLWQQLSDLMAQERATEGGVLDVDVSTPASITAHAPAISIVTRSHSRPADRRAVQARDLPVRRLAHGREPA